MVVAWGETVFSPLDTATLAGHLRFVRVTCSQLVASLIARTNQAKEGYSASSISPTQQFQFLAHTTSTIGSCQGLFIPSSLLLMLHMEVSNLSSQRINNLKTLNRKQISRLSFSHFLQKLRFWYHIF